MSFIRLNLGCGKQLMKGEEWVNVDLCDEADVKHDLTQPLPFDDKSVREIRAIHVIESFHKPEFLRIIKDWERVLEGWMTIEFTDLNKTIGMYLSRDENDHKYGKWGLYGNQEVECPPREYHAYVYTDQELFNILAENHFTNISFTTDDVTHNIKRDYRVHAMTENYPHGRD